MFRKWDEFIYRRSLPYIYIYMVIATSSQNKAISTSSLVVRKQMVQGSRFVFMYPITCESLQSSARMQWYVTEQPSPRWASRHTGRSNVGVVSVTSVMCHLCIHWFRMGCSIHLTSNPLQLPSACPFNRNCSQPPLLLIGPHRYNYIEGKTQLQ